MTEQKRRIIESAEFIRKKFSSISKINTAIVTYKNPLFLKLFNIKRTVKYSKIPPQFYFESKNDGEFILALSKNGNKKIFILNGRLNYYNGYHMRDVSHYVYVLKSLGVKNLIIIDEVGHLNPRFKTGGVSLIFDHINIMGDNPLIGENDNSIGPRFPDMSNAYDSKLYQMAEKLMIKKKFTYYPSIYLGITGPETETEAECMFYREIGSDVLGYSLVPENLAAVHSGIKCLAFGMISRELVADRLREISDNEKTKNRLKAEREFSTILNDLIRIL